MIGLLPSQKRDEFCAWFHIPTCQFWPMKRLRRVSVVKLTTFLASHEDVLITCCLSFQVFRESIFCFLKSACVNMIRWPIDTVMQIRVQIGDTRRAFFANPPWSVEDLKITFCVRFRRQDILLASLVYLLVYVSTHWVPIALLRQNKPFPLLYLGHAQIISIGSTSFFQFYSLTLLFLPKLRIFTK